MIMCYNYLEKHFIKKTTEKAIRRGKDGVKKQSTRKDGKKSHKNS